MKKFHLKGLLLVTLMMAIVVGFSQPRFADAAANIKFEATDVYLQQGYVRIVGYFYNNGDNGAAVSTASMNVAIADSNGNHIWADSCTFHNVQAYVGAGGRTNWMFDIKNPNCPYYSREIRWSVDTILRW